MRTLFKRSVLLGGALGVTFKLGDYDSRWRRPAAAEAEKTKYYRGYSRAQVTGAIDHSVLKPNSQPSEILQAADVAVKLKSASLCIRPVDVVAAASRLAGSAIPVCTVIGFPHGTSTTATKVFETKDACRGGATEIDMVVNIAALVSGDYNLAQEDIQAVVAAAHAHGAIVKVILETCLLTNDQIKLGCLMAEKAGADFVKTSTGFGAAGATVEHVKLMRAAVGSRLQVKASGGIRSLDQLADLLDAGADRCGCSATEAIVQEFDAKSS